METNETVHGCETCGRVCAAAGKRMEPRPLPDDAGRLKWWLELSRQQTARMWELLGDILDADQQSEILNQLGRNCAKSIQWAQQYVGDPEGFFQFMFNRCGEVITYDRDQQVITVVTRERDCDCLLVNSAKISPVYCNCSIGWQQYTYETILGRKVDVTVEKAVVRGDLQCMFRIRVLDEPV
jgi:hypothetical protein